MAVSNKIRGLLEQGSWIRRMFEEGIELKRKFGEDNVFDLSLGNPILEPPDEFFAELRRIADSPSPGMHRYMPNSGYPETRAAVAAQLAEETGLRLHRRRTDNDLRSGRRAERRSQDAAGSGGRSGHIRALLRGILLLRGQSRRNVQGGSARRGIPAGHGRAGGDYHGANARQR